jgi:Zn finger protein HypA/HybF involved in hydrogenase expression
MGLQDRLRESLTGGGSGGSDPPEYQCDSCQHKFNSNKSPRNITCPDCESDDISLLANPDQADGSHPLDPTQGDEPTGPDATDAPDGDTDPADGEVGPVDGDIDRSDAATEQQDAEADTPDDEEAAKVSELLTSGRYRCQSCREAFDNEGAELRCPECGSEDVEERFNG